MGAAHSPETIDLSVRHLTRLAVRAMLPSFLAIAALALVFVYVPVPQGDESPVALLVFASVMFIVYTALISWGVLRLRNSQSPIIEGLFLLSVLATMLVFSFAYSYMAIYASDATAFTEPLGKVSSVYFTVTVLATVGFGDITPVTDLARIVVTFQMLVGVSLLTFGVKVILQSASTRRQGLMSERHTAVSNTGG